VKRIPCKVFAPASVANVAVGYDILGFAIDGIGDEVIFRTGSKPGLTLKSIRGNKKLSKDIKQNCAAYSAHQLLLSLGLEEEPIEMELFKNMRIGTGLGSSAASSVAGAFGVNEYLGRPYDRNKVLHFATLGEQLADGSYHADNTGPSLYGGITLIRDNKSLDIVRLPAIRGIKVIVIYPHVQILTKDSRDILSETVSLEKHIAQSGNLAGFVAALFRSDLELLRRSLKDVIIEPQRAQLIPSFSELKEAALNAGALGFSISGAGPSMFAICPNSFVAENIQSVAEQIYSDLNINIDCYISDINLQGAKKY